LTPVNRPSVNMTARSYSRMMRTDIARMIASSTMMGAKK
jgi:hypothetical protein